MYSWETKGHFLTLISSVVRVVFKIQTDFWVFIVKNGVEFQYFSNILAYLMRLIQIWWKSIYYFSPFLHENKYFVSSSGVNYLQNGYLHLNLISFNNEYALAIL